MRGGIRLVFLLSIVVLWLIFTIGPLVTEVVSPQEYSPPSSNPSGPVIKSDNLVYMPVDSSCLSIGRDSVNSIREGMGQDEDVPVEEGVDTRDEKIDKDDSDGQEKGSNQGSDGASESEEDGGDIEEESEDEGVDDSSKGGGDYVIIYGGIVETDDEKDTSVDEAEETGGTSGETEVSEETEESETGEEVADDEEDVEETEETVEETEDTIDSEETEESVSLGPIAYWAFDEGIGTSVNDGNGNTGRLNIYPWTKGITEELTDYCVSFNGDNYIEVPKSTELDITGPFTVTLWINPHDLCVDRDEDGSPDVQYIIHGGSCTWGLRIDSGYWLRFYTDTRTNPITNDFVPPNAWLSSVSGIEEDRWTFVAIVYNSENENMYLYTLPEGETEPHVSSRPQGGDIRTNESHIYIGSLNLSWEQPFYGCLDEVKIYNSALTWDEIIAETRDNIILYYNFNEGNGIEINDITENENNGSLNTDNYNPWISELSRNYIEFNGQVNIEIPKSEDLDITGPFTVTLWINPEDISIDRDEDGSPDTQNIIHGGACTWGLQIDTGYWLRFYTDTRPDATAPDFEAPNAWLSSVSGIREDRWTFVAIVYNSENENMYLYTLPEGETEPHVSSRPQGGDIRTNESPIYIGSLNSSWEQPFYGCLDEVKIYNRALSPEEIRAEAGVE